MATNRAIRMSTDERREQLLNAGVELLAERGYDQVSIEEIAEAAGVSKGLLYHYFPTKKDFLLAALRRGEEELEARLRPDPAVPPAEQFNAGLDAFLDDVERHPEAYSAIFRRLAGGDLEVTELLEEGRKRRVETIVAGIAGWDDTPLERTAELETAIQGWVFFAEGAALRWLEHGGLDREQLRLMLQMALGGAVAAAKAAGDLRAAAVD
jgi:AcrR family transcriptional regulator